MVDSEHPELETLERFRRRELPPDAITAVGDHLAACAKCRHRLFAAEDAYAEPHSPTEGSSELHQLFEADMRLDLGSALHQDLSGRARLPHATVDDLAGLVNNRLSPGRRELTEGHLQFCASCRADMEELVAFKSRVAAFPPQEHAPPPPLTAAQRVQRGMRRVRQRPEFPLAVRALAAILVMALLLSGLTSLARIAGTRAEETRLVQRVRTLEQEKQGFQKRILSAQTTLGAVKQRALKAEKEAADLRRRRRRRSPTSGPGSGIKDGETWVDVAGARWRKDAALLPEVALVITARQVAKPPVVERLAVSLPPGPGAALPLLFPVRTVVPTDLPTFRWRQRDGATGYVVRVFDETDKRELVVSPLVQATEWTSSAPLPRGHLLWWEVSTAVETAPDPSAPPPPPEASGRSPFQVLEESTASALEQARQTHVGSPLTLAVLWMNAGLLVEAQEQFEALLRDNPNNETLERILEAIRQWQSSG